MASMMLCPSGRLRTLEACFSGAPLEDRTEGALCTSTKRYGGGLGGQGCRLTFQSSRNLAFSTQASASASGGQGATVLRSEGSSPSTHVEEGKSDQTWEAPDISQPPVVSTKDLVSLQIPSK